VKEQESTSWSILCYFWNWVLPFFK